MSRLQTAPIKNFALGIYDGPHATPKEIDEGPVFLGIKNVTPEGRLDLSEIRHVSVTSSLYHKSYFSQLSKMSQSLLAA